MKIRDLAYLSIRVLAIYLFLLGCKQIFTLIDFTLPAYVGIPNFSSYFISMLIVLVIPSLIYVAASLTLWFLAKRISLLLIVEGSEDAEFQGNKALEGFVLSMVGVVIVVLALSSFVKEGLLYLVYTNDVKYTFPKNQTYRVMEQAIRLILGVILVLKAEGFALILRKIRNAGLKHLEERK